MSEARRLLKMVEAESSDYDRGLGKALGIKMPDDFDLDHQTQDARVLLQQSHDQNVLERLQSSIFIVSKTFATYTPESVEAGDAEDRGFIFEDEEMEFEELIRELGREGYIHLSSYPVTPQNAAHVWVTTDLHVTDYGTGEETEYSLHVNRIIDGGGINHERELTSLEMYTIYKESGLIK